MHQLPGMVFVGLVAFLTSYFFGLLKLNPEVNPFLSAIFMTVAARVYAWIFGNERPLIYIFSGLCLLVPGTAVLIILLHISIYFLLDLRLLNLFTLPQGVSGSVLGVFGINLFIFSYEICIFFIQLFLFFI